MEFERQAQIEAEALSRRVLIHGILRRLRGEPNGLLPYSAVSLRPDHAPILFNKAGRYDVLLDHIRTHQYFMGLNQKRSISWEAGVTDWYDNRYLPTVLEIRENQVMKDFPRRNEADLYLWISDHRYFLSRSIDHDIGPEEATLSVQRSAQKGLFGRVLGWLERFMPRPSPQSGDYRRTLHPSGVWMVAKSPGTSDCSRRTFSRPSLCRIWATCSGWGCRAVSSTSLQPRSGRVSVGCFWPHWIR